MSPQTNMRIMQKRTFVSASIPANDPWRTGKLAGNTLLYGPGRNAVSKPRGGTQCTLFFRSGFQLRMRVMAETLAPSTDWLIEGPQVNTDAAVLPVHRKRKWRPSGRNCGNRWST